MPRQVSYELEAVLVFGAPRSTPQQPQPGSPTTPDPSLGSHRPQTLPAATAPLAAARALPGAVAPLNGPARLAFRAAVARAAGVVAGAVMMERVRLLRPELPQPQPEPPSGDGREEGLVPAAAALGPAEARGTRSWGTEVAAADMGAPSLEVRFTVRLSAERAAAVAAAGVSGAAAANGEVSYGGSAAGAAQAVARLLRVSGWWGEMQLDDRWLVGWLPDYRTWLFPGGLAVTRRAAKRDYGEMPSPPPGDTPGFCTANK
jgi:hypothetical protein